jgi:uncharacterized ferritin-like protein (DUF455 family)
MLITVSIPCEHAVNNLFEMAEHCLYQTDINYKIQVTHQAKARFDAQTLDFNDYHRPIRPSHAVCFPERPQLLPPRDMPKRGFASIQGQAALFHALAHIEFVAIYLAWDIVYRFRGLPQAFYADWLRIADEEATHFALIRSHLNQLGYDYGDLPAHQGLWNHAQETDHAVLARLAIVPRCLEARGLDVTPTMIARFEKMHHTQAAALLTRIYQDEIGHVARGSYWFNYLARLDGGSPKQRYRELLLRYYPGKPKGPFNREARIMAGFTHDELDWLEDSA